MWLLIGLIVAVIGSFILYRWWKWRQGRLLHATVATEDATTYTVTYERLLEESKPVEHIRLVLMFAAKMLYNMGDQAAHADQKQEFLRVMARVANAPLDETSDVNVLTYCSRSLDVSEISNPGSGRTIKATLGYVDASKRRIHTQLPVSWYEYQFVDSWLAIVQTSLPKLNPRFRQLLRDSVERLYRIYTDEDVDPSSLDALHSAPNRAFMEAAV